MNRGKMMACRPCLGVAAKIRAAAKSVLQQGLSPEKIALTVCVGSAVGILPIPWGTMLICAALATWLRLNQAAMQAVNYLVYPLQIVLFIPFFTLGDKFLAFGPSLSTELLKEALHGRIRGSGAAFCCGMLKAVCVWLAVVPLLALLLYPLLLSILRRRSQ
jgi:uncharacterized protein (DUF2062 family)